MILLDTSAVLAHLYQEPGWEIVGESLVRGEAWVAAVTWLELNLVLQRMDRRAELLDIYRLSLAGTVDISAEVADAAFEIRLATQGRVPAMDSLIAGAAKVRGFRLIHRDKHLAQIPTGLLQQTLLPARA